MDKLYLEKQIEELKKTLLVKEEESTQLILVLDNKLHSLRKELDLKNTENALLHEKLEKSEKFNSKLLEELDRIKQENKLLVEKLEESINASKDIIERTRRFMNNCK